MTALVDALLEDLDDLSSLMAANLTNKGVTASASDGLTTLANKILDIDAEITLSVNKTILNYQSGETATLTAQYSGNPGVTIGLYNAVTGSKIGDMIDNQDGTYTYTYISTGVGDISMTAVSGQIESNSVTIEDCYAYITSFTDWTSFSNKGTNYVFSPFTLPTNHQIEIKQNSNNGIKFACGDTTHTNSAGWLEWIYAWYIDNHTIYYRTSTNSETSQNLSYSISSSTIFKLTYNGTSLKLYAGDTQLTSLTSYDTLSLTRLLRVNSAGISYVDWIKVKPL